MVRNLLSEKNAGRFLLLFSLLLWMTCARIVAPTGGPKDEHPPQLDSLNSTPNYQTRFQKQDIVLTFDEWLAELRDVFNHVVVTPPLQTRPEVRLKK